ncbi:MAG: hypothetical protein ACO3FI_09365 [Cyclobacteriaceae bacterium]
MKNITALLIFFFILSGNESVKAQKTSVASELNGFFKKYPQTKPVIFLSHNRVIPGDSILFSAGMYDPKGAVFTRRQILNLELVDQQGKIVHRRNVLMADGTAESFLAIPESLREGFYLLRAYTGFLKNYGEDSYAWSTIEVIRERSLQRNLTPPEISIHPEGGQLIAGVTNHLILKYHGVPLGSALKIIGTVSGELGTAYVENSGISSVFIRPTAGEQVHAEYSPVIRSTETDSKPEGVTLFFRENQQILRLAFTGKKNYRKETEVVLFGKGEARALPIVSDYSDSLIYKLPPNLPPDYYRILVFNADRKIIAERALLLSRFQQEVKLEVSTDTPGLREKTDVRIQITDQGGRPVRATAHLAVADARSIRESSQDEILSLIQRYRASGSVEQPRRSSRINDELIAIHDNLLPENWNDPAYRPEHQSQSTLRFSGSVTRSDSKPLRDSTSVMLFLQKQMIGYEAPIVDGRFDVPVYFDFTGEDELFFAVHRNDSAVSGAVVILDRDTVSVRRAPVSVQMLSRDPFADFLIRKKATERSYRFFKTAASVTIPEQPDPNKPFEDALRGADVSVQIDDYVVFPTLEDVIREIVPSLKHRRTGDRTSVRVFLYSPVVTNTPILSTGDPLYIIDGQMTLSTEYFMNMNPGDLISIRIVRNVQKLTKFGYLGKNGVVLVRTKNPDAIRQFTENSVFPVNGLNVGTLSLTAPQSDPRIPDLRTLLHWDAAHVTDDQGNLNFSFTTGDIAGPFTIRVEGITEDGYPFSAEQKILVKDK